LRSTTSQTLSSKSIALPMDFGLAYSLVSKPPQSERPGKYKLLSGSCPPVYDQTWQHDAIPSVSPALKKSVHIHESPPRAPIVISLRRTICSRFMRSISCSMVTRGSSLLSLPSPDTQREMKICVGGCSHFQLFCSPRDCFLNF
jgi:hypothetical protein